MSSNSANDPQKLPWSLLRAGGRHGLSDSEKRDPIGLAVAALNRLASSDLIDRLGIRKASEQTVYRVTSAGFRTAGNVGRTFARAGKATRGNRVPAAKNTGLFDLTPGEDEQMLADVVGEFAEEMVRPAAAEANETCAAPDELLKASLEIGLPILGVPEDLGGIATERSSMAGTLVHEALGKGDMGLAVAALSPGAVATALSLWGTDEQQSTYLPAFTGDEVPAAALALAEPTALFDPTAPATKAEKKGDGYVLNGVKSGVVRGADAELFVVGAELDGKPQLFIVESAADGITIESDPSMGLRAASLSRLLLKDVAVEKISLLGDARRLPRLRAVLPPGLVRTCCRHRAGRARLRHPLRQGARGLRRADRPPPVGRLHGRQHRRSSCRACAWSPTGPRAGWPRASPPSARSPSPAACVPSAACRSAWTAYSCWAGTASSRSTRSNGGTATCGPSA